MSLLVVGLSHRTAPVALLEKATFGSEALPDALAELTDGEHVAEAMLLSTCNRVEAYAEVDKFHGGVNEVSELLARRTGADLATLGAHLYVHYEDAAVAHLFTVAAGLDSMVLGEAQILGQLRSAYAAAQDAQTAGRRLHDLMQQALRVGKRAHSETGIGRAGASLVGVGVRLAGQALSGLAGRPALLVGAGSMGALAGATLRRAGVLDITVASRTRASAERLASALDGRAVPVDSLEDSLSTVDVVVSITGATGIVVTAEAVERAQKLRGQRPLVVLDLALPRDVDPRVADLPGVRLVDLDALAGALENEQVGQEVEAARAIVAAEVGAFLATQRAVHVAPTVAALRTRAAEVVDAELARLAGRLPDLDPATRSEVETAVRRVVSTLLHAPTVRVKELATAPGGHTYAAALRELFELDPAATDAVTRAAVTMEADR